ncbi:MAG: GNAT family N-acetyltransferase [Propionibacteriaceae bacterium]
MDLVDIFPAFGIRIECGPVTLRAIRESDAPRIAELAAAGIHAQDARPFLRPWNLGDDQPLTSLQFYYRTWASVAPESWTLMFAVERDDKVVGAQDLKTADFPILRTGETGSWLGRPHQGRGTGTLMRQAILAFAFDHLGAIEMRSTAWADNPNSHRVSEKCGYLVAGTSWKVRENTRVRQDDLVVTPETVVRPPHEVLVSGLEPFLAAVHLTES